jgi:hypothetical protein
MNFLPMLAAAPNDDDPTRFLWPAVAMVAAIVVLAVCFKVVRKRLRQAETAPPAGFTLGDLRQLVKEGKMTPEEFERAKNKVLEAHKKAQAIKPAQETTATKEFPPRA